MVLISSSQSQVRPFRARLNIASMATWSTEKIRTVSKYNFMRGLSIDECMDELRNVLRDDCPHRTIVFRCHRDFQHGNFSGTPSGPSNAPTWNVVKKVKKSRLKTGEWHVEETLAISGTECLWGFTSVSVLKVRKVSRSWSKLAYCKTYVAAYVCTWVTR